MRKETEIVKVQKLSSVFDHSSREEVQTHICLQAIMRARRCLRVTKTLVITRPKQI